MHQRSTGLLIAAVVCGLLGLAATAATAANVDVTVAVTGTPAFGATVTAKATITINDGSSTQSILWKQTGGATAALSGTTTDSVTAVLAGRGAYRAALIHALSEPPLTAGQLPPNVPVPPEEFPGGLQNRFGVVGVNPFALEEGGVVTLTVDVRTSSGTYQGTTHVATPLPWTSSLGTRNVPPGVPVILHGKTQASYTWAMTVPAGSTATLTDPTSQSPEFTPDTPGTYQLTVTDLASSSPVTIPVIAGLWRGVIVGQDANSRPQVDTACTGCHAVGTPLDLFTPWVQTGHAEILTQNVNNPAGHYSEACMSCHTVGYDKAAANNGIDDQTDWAALVASGLLTHGDPTNWTNILLQFPKSAKQANIQCENCHGPQTSEAHTKGDARVTLSSDVCAVCHGEPARHGRFQQWQLSGHANYETAVAEGMSGGCAQCHTAQGFLAWGKSGYTASSVQVTWTADEVHPQTCQTCHDPHGIGTTSGKTSNATVRITDTTPPLRAGFTATDVGQGAICMTCHNGRRGLRNDSNFTVADASRAPHVGPQADVLMGQNFYLVDVGTPGYHARVDETCVTCHMTKTPPPDIISYNKGGTNHTFYASKEICSECHATITAEDVQGPVEEKVATLTAAIDQALTDLVKAQLALGSKIDLGGLKTLTSAADFTNVDFAESHGRQAMTVTLSDASTVGPVAMNSVRVVPPTGSSFPIYNVADPVIPKSGWNLLMVESDASEGVHNPGLVSRVLDVSIYALQHPTTTPGGGYTDPGLGGGPGDGAGAVSCTTPYVYWAEIATHSAGLNGSQWRTDMTALNLASAAANLRFILHTDSGNLEATGTVPAAGQGVFADIVGMLGVEAKGALEICSDRPLLVTGRIFNQAAQGTFGQFLDGHVASLGLTAGQYGQLIGLRQETGKYRTNIEVTNGGTQPAQAEITLFDNAGTVLNTFTLTVPAGQVVQDVQPFLNRANAPDLGWGFATVKVLSGSNVMTSASVVDSVTNDPTYVPGKR